MATNPQYTSITLEDQKVASTQEQNELEQPFDDEFWLKVQEKFDSDEFISWSRAMDEIRVDRLLAEYESQCLLVIIRDWPVSEKYQNRPELVASLEHMVSRFTEIILDKDSDEEYKYFRDEDTLPRPTLLHLAASQNFVHVATKLVAHYPSLLYLETEQVNGERGYLPVEMALQNYQDETAAFLLSQMKPDWVHDLFIYNVELKRPKFSFGEIITHKNSVTNKTDMKKTVVSVLDSFVNPHWPYLPERKKDLEKENVHIERAWASVPDDPINYDFYYNVLDGDHFGRMPKVNGQKNKQFDANSKSNLKCLSESGNKEAILHPVVRMLVMQKWKKFGLWWFRFQGAFYLIFLLLLSYALIHGSTCDNPNNYNESADQLRLFCELLSIIFVMFYVVEEIDQAERDSGSYFKDPYNYFDWFGLTLIIVIIPLRIIGSKSQWSIAGIGYLINFLRMFKFSCVTRTTGLYTKTLAKIIYRDISRFIVLFFVVFIGFCGAMYMALKATGSQHIVTDYPWLMLSAVRVLAEQQPVDEDYSKFSWLPILIMLCYMGLVIVVLLNVLIAQLSYTYSEAKNNAKLQYAIDRMFIITSLEHSRLGRFNLRVKYYQEGARVSETQLVDEMLEYSEERHPWESMEEKLSILRNLMRKVVHRGSQTA